MSSGCITSHETCNSVKYHTNGRSGKGFAQALSHFGWQIPLEYKVKTWLHFYQSTPIWKWYFRVPSIEAVDTQGRGSNSGHQISRRGERLVVRIKYREIIHQQHGLTYDRFQPKIFTLLSLSGTQQKKSYF